MNTFVGKICLVGLLLCFSSGLSKAQEVSNCQPGLSHADLDISDVRARLFNDGSFFRSGKDGFYTVPKNDPTPKQSIREAGIWLGGKVDGELRMIRTQDGSRELWPGPLSDDGIAADDCSDYDRMYRVSVHDIYNYEKGIGTPNPDLLDWPYDLGAPVHDGDGILDNYDLENGDRPQIFGDQTVWWLMNDSGNAHTKSLTRPLRVEIRVMAFAANFAWYFEEQNTSTYYFIELTNKNEKPITDLHFGLAVDADIGNSKDDFIGSDLSQAMGYIWNGDDFDEPHLGGYGDKPPALGISYLLGPLVTGDGIDNDKDGEIDEGDERLSMNSFMSFQDDSSVKGAPQNSEEAFGLMQSRWRDGRAATIGGNGIAESAEETSFLFSGEAGKYWSEENIDGKGRRSIPGDRKVLSSIGPFELEPGQTQLIRIGIFWAQGSDRFASVKKLKENLVNTYGVMNEGGLLSRQPRPRKYTEANGSVSLSPSMSVRLYPNPTSEFIIAELDNFDEKSVSTSLIDLQGRVRLDFGSTEPLTGSIQIRHDISGLPNGAYYYRIRSEDFSHVLPVFLSQ